jgi:hypothetical protein
MLQKAIGLWFLGDGTGENKPFEKATISQVG